MKRVSIFIFILCCFIFIPSVRAVTDEIEDSTTTTTVPIVTTTTTTQPSIEDTTKKAVVKTKKTTTTSKKTTTQTTTTTSKLEDKVVVLSENELKFEISKSTVLVEAAEKSLILEDYEDALSSVSKLSDSVEKKDLLSRLETVKLNIAVKEKCPSNEEKECEECQECNNISWIILCIGLFVCLVAENIYLFFRKSRMYD